MSQLPVPGRRGLIKASDLRPKVPDPIPRSAAASASLTCRPPGWALVAAAGARLCVRHPAARRTLTSADGTCLSVCESHFLVKRFPVSPPFFLSVL